MSERNGAGRDRGVLVLYTGGTIGSAPREPGDCTSPKTVVPWECLWRATPELRRLEEQGLRTEAVSFEKPLDSCNVGPAEWARMARIIADRYDDFEGFVVLHGTDTMAYSASMLSFMLRGLGKPVVFTGAQRSALADVRNDAVQNFITALLVAHPRFSHLPVIREVMIVFGGMILRGNRTVKVNTTGYRAYRSPNLEPIGEVGDRILINERLVRTSSEPPGPLQIRTRLETQVLPLFMYPGVTVEQVRAQLELPGLRAVVVQSFGSGNVPLKPGFLEAFRQARQERGILLANVSQCQRGPVELGTYEASAELLQAGFVSAGDITVEAAQCKLMWLLGDPDATLEEVEADFQVSMAGEQSLSQHVTRLSDRAGQIRASGDRDPPGLMRLPGRALAGQWDPRRIDRALLRLRRSCILSAAEEPVTVRVFADLAPEEVPQDDHPSLMGRYRKWPRKEPGLMVFDATQIVEDRGRPGERLSFTFVVDTPGATLTWERADLAVLVREVGV